MIYYDLSTKTTEQTWYVVKQKQTAHTQKQKPTVLLPLKSFLLGKSCQFDCEFH